MAVSLCLATTPLLPVIIILCYLLSFFTSSSVVALAQQLITEQEFDIVVAQDNTGDFTTITEAVTAAPSNSKRRFIIKINSGVYNENVFVGKDKKNITFVGDGMDETILRASKSNRTGFKTFDTATLAIFGEGFVAIELAVENVADDNSQAVALMVNEDSAYYKCRFFGYQDTLYAKTQMQFFRDCEVYGSIDFIFGNSRVVFQKCKILVRTPIKRNQTSLVVTAQSRDREEGIEGIVFQRCTFKAATRNNFPSSVSVFLGRPWKDYARVVVMESFLDKIIHPKGWIEWDGAPKRNETATYLEYNNSGPGADTSQRVAWPGYRTIDRTEANNYTVRHFINGEEWIPQTGIPVTLDLSASVALTYDRILVSACLLLVLAILH